MIASRRGRSTVVAVLLVLHGLTWAEQKEQVSKHRARVAKRGKMIPITRITPGTIKVDGDLSDWLDLRDRAVVISQYFHWNYGHQRFGRRPDAALYKLMHDGDALYVAVQVVDNHVLCPSQGQDTKNADRAQLHIDVRPLSGPGPKLGGSKHTDGVYILDIPPPPPDGGTPRWQQVGPQVRRIGPIDVAGRRLKRGYQIECRLPRTSLDPKAKLDRLSQPIGFEPYIRERDPDPSGKQTSMECGYSWGNLRACFRYASRFACAHEGYEPELGLPFLQILRARMPRSGTRLFFQTALITTIEERDAGDMFELYHRFAATDFDRVDDPAVPSQPTVVPADRVVTLPYPELGIAVHFRKLRLSKLAPGRYYIETEYPGPDLPGRSVRYYARFAKGAVTAEIVRPSKDETDVLQEIVGRRPQLALDTHYALAKESVAGKLSVTLPTTVWFDLSEQAERAAEAGETGAGPCSFRVELMRPVWRGDLPLRANGTVFEIPGEVLKQGRYELRVTARHPDGATSAIAWIDPSAPIKLPKGRMIGTAEAPLVVRPPREVTLGTTVQDAAKLLTRPMKIGDPTRSRFPKDDMPDCQARSIHDLLLYDGRIYVGCGDWERNRGPIDVWSFAPAAEGIPETFVKEFTVDEEAVEVFREYGGKLYVPGIDGCHRTGQDWSLGNLYVKAAGKWQKLRTVPKGILVRDVAELDGKLYVSTCTTAGAELFESEDGGRSWRRGGWNARRGWFGHLLPLAEGLLVTCSDPQMGAHRYANGKLEPLSIPVLPGCGRSPCPHIMRLERFGRGAVYTAEYKGRRWPLFYLEDLEQGAVVVEQFRDPMVNDIVVRDGRCYVLTGQHVGGKEPTCSGAIYVSPDLRSWTRLAAFTVPSMPNSMELTDDTFYVALANHQPWQSADAESGTIWRIAE